MTSVFDTTRNLSFYAIPAAWIISVTPHAYAIISSQRFDNRSPRTFVKTIEQDQTIDKATKARIIRCEGAQQNGFENLGLFAAAVVAGNVASLPNQTLNLLSGAYLATRMVYNLIYITQTTELVAALRSVTFLAGVFQCMVLFAKAGSKLAERTLL